MRFGDDGVAAAPHTGVDVRSRGAVCALGDDGAALAPHTGADACARGADVRASMELLRHPTPELPCALEDVELLYALGDAGVAAAPHTGAAVHSQRCDCCVRLGIRGLLWRPHTGAVAHAL